jgi:hypothetical protein
MSGMSITRQAIDVLQQNDITPELLLSQMVDKLHDIVTYHDEQQHAWHFVARRRCRLFLLAKTPEMKNYEDIYCSARL